MHYLRKKGLFLRVDNKGRCNECLIKIKKEEEALKIEKEKEETIKFEAYYAKLLSCFKKQQEVVVLGNNPIMALEFIPILEDKIKGCEVLKEVIQFQFVVLREFYFSVYSSYKVDTIL